MHKILFNIYLIRTNIQNNILFFKKNIPQVYDHLGPSHALRQGRHGRGERHGGEQ